MHSYPGDPMHIFGDDKIWEFGSIDSSSSSQESVGVNNPFENSF
jgi:hypothetical protein